MASPVDVFISYAVEDDDLRQELEKHIAPLERDGVLRAWHSGRASPGAGWPEQRDERLRSARVVVLLVSASYLASDLLYQEEMMPALARAKQGDALVIPVLVRSCDWRTAPFSGLTTLPRNEIPVTIWTNRDEAWTDVAAGLREAFESPARASMLKSFEVDGFRTFKRLRVDRLARVNLVVGRNNVGKTMLLEALRFYVSGDLAHLARLLREREELLPDVADDGEGGVVVHFGALAYGRPTLTDALTIQLREPSDPERGIVLRISAAPARIVAKRGSAGSTWDLVARGLSNGGSSASRPAFVPQAQGIPQAALGQLWDAVVLQGGEERVTQCLRILAPVERITLIQQGERRVAVARVAGRDQPAPLRSLGDGVLRAFQLALAIERSLEKSPLPKYALDEPMLLVDEIETGIHYSALPDVWRFVFHAARERGVQVFATTHSWDCIEAFQQAAAGEPNGSATLIRLEQKGDEHRAVLLEQDELATVTKHHVEVR